MLKFEKVMVKPLLRNVNLLNVVLFLAAVVFASHSLLPLLDVRVNFAMPAPAKSPVTAERTVGEAETPSVTEYTVIAEKNLFHPDREIPVEKDKSEQHLPKPDFVLFGTLIAGNTSLAYLEDLKAPRSTAGRGKRQIALKEGDKLSGFTLKEIEPDKVVMVRGDETITIPVYPRDRDVAPAATPTPTAQAPVRQSPTAAVTDQRSNDLRAAREERMKRLKALRDARRQRRQQVEAGTR